MRMHKRVLIVGLPKFSSELAYKLNRYCPNAKFTSLNTYYRFIDKLRAPFQIWKSDIVFSINGSLQKSRVFDLALRLNKKLFIHWAGTDVLKARQSYKSGNYVSKYIAHATHHCDVQWIKDELAEIGIDAVLQSFVVLGDFKPLKKFPEQFQALTYLYPGREEFYGIKSIIKCAEEYPEIKFLIAGSASFSGQIPSNIKFLGWIENMSEYIASSCICIRVPEHDGLSSFVLESLAQGRYVLRNYNFPHCSYSPDVKSMIRLLGECYERFESGSLELNKEGAEYVSNTFKKEKIFPSFLDKLGIEN